MKYIIIGLGNYGHVLAEELSALGHEIIGADISESRVDSIKDKVATAFVIDATDEQSLSVLNMDEEFHLKLIALKRANKVTNCLGISLMERHVKNELPGDEKVEEGDELVCYGKYRDFQSFWKAI